MHRQFIILIGVLLFLAPFAYLAVKFGAVETPKKTEDRKLKKRLKEAEKYSSLPIEVQKICIEAENKMNDAGPLLAIRIISVLFFITLIFWIFNI